MIKTKELVRSLAARYHTLHPAHLPDEEASPETVWTFFFLRTELPSWFVHQLHIPFPAEARKGISVFQFIFFSFDCFEWLKNRFYPKSLYLNVILGDEHPALFSYHTIAKLLFGRVFRLINPIRHRSREDLSWARPERRTRRFGTSRARGTRAAEQGHNEVHLCFFGMRLLFWTLSVDTFSSFFLCISSFCGWRCEIFFEFSTKPFVSGTRCSTRLPTGKRPLAPLSSSLAASCTKFASVGEVSDLLCFGSVMHRRLPPSWLGQHRLGSTRMEWVNTGW